MSNAREFLALNEEGYVSFFLAYRRDSSARGWPVQLLELPIEKQDSLEVKN